MYRKIIATIVLLGLTACGGKSLTEAELYKKVSALSCTELDDRLVSFNNLIKGQDQSDKESRKKSSSSVLDASINSVLTDGSMQRMARKNIKRINKAKKYKKCK